MWSIRSLLACFLTIQLLIIGCSNRSSDDGAGEGPKPAPTSEGDGSTGNSSGEAREEDRSGAGVALEAGFVAPVDGDSVDRVIDVAVDVAGWADGEPIWLVVGSPGGGDFPLRGSVDGGVARWSGVTVGAVKDDGVEFSLVVVRASSGGAQDALDQVQAEGNGTSDVLQFDGVVELDRISVVRTVTEDR